MDSNDQPPLTARVGKSAFYFEPPLPACRFSGCGVQERRSSAPERVAG